MPPGVFSPSWFDSSYSIATLPLLAQEKGKHLTQHWEAAACDVRETTGLSSPKSIIPCTYILASKSFFLLLDSLFKFSLHTTGLTKDSTDSSVLRIFPWKNGLVDQSRCVHHLTDQRAWNKVPLLLEPRAQDERKGEGPVVRKKCLEDLPITHKVRKKSWHETVSNWVNLGQECSSL